LQEELANADLSPLPQWVETSHLPYLCAVVKEALRIHAPVGFPLERVVPSGGVTLYGHYFPEGTIVSCNPSVIGFNKEVYGQRYAVEEFWPERWLEADEQEEAMMERRSMTFGAGKRMCLGKHISLLEIHKLVPLLLTRFKVTNSHLKVIGSLISNHQISLAYPERSWTVWNTFFLHQKDFLVQLEPI
jgi:cytochrome P450